MVWLFLLISLFFPRLTFAVDPIVTITNFPSSIVTGDTFPITFTVSSGFTGSFHYKSVGDSDTDISIFPLCSSNFNNCSSLIISDTSPVTATAYAKINTTTSTNYLFIRIAEAEKHEKTTDSNVVTIQSIQPTPTLTPVPTDTPIPTNTPTPTDTPEPTNTPIPTTIPSLTPTKIPTSTPVPTVTLFPTVTPDPLPSYDPLPTNDPPSQILGVSETKSTFTLSPALIPTIFIIVGAGLLLIPLIISKIKLKRR